MSKEKKNNKKQGGVNVRELIDRHQEICDRIEEIASLCEAENNRERTEAENTEYETLLREDDIIRMKIQASENSHARERVADPDTMLRETLLEDQKPAVIKLVRETQMSTSVEGTGIIPVNQQEMLKPLREGLIYDKVGLKVMTGLPAGQLRWPKHGKAQAKWVAEGERAEDSNIDFSKLDCKPERFVAAVPLTRELLESTAGVVESVVRQEMPAAVVDLVNEAMFTTVGTYTDKKDNNKTKNKAVVGPFVKAAETPFEFAGDVPTRKELIKMKAKVAATGIQFVAPCWVMTENMKAELEDQKVDAGSGRFTCENGMVLGYPVFVTSKIGDGNVGFGDWIYQAAGFFGPMNLAVDPYTLLRNNATDFVLNGHFQTVTLYPEAFVLGHKKVTTAGGGGASQGGQEG